MHPITKHQEDYAKHSASPESHINASANLQKYTSPLVAFNKNDKSVNDRSISLADIPKITLSCGIEVNDYTNDHAFAERMQTMSLAEAAELRLLKNQYPNEFPMPCMAITANEMLKTLHELRQQFNLTPEDAKILSEFEQDIKNLSPQYPYNQALSLSYKFLLYKYLLDFTYFKKALETYEYCVPEVKRVLEKFTYKNIWLLAGFYNTASLEDISKLPWNTMQTNMQKFKKELAKIYVSEIIFRDALSCYLQPLETLATAEIIVPYTKPLGIEFFNKTWPLPIWLAGCSLDSDLTEADGFQLGASAFFEHDLFHLEVKLYNNQHHAVDYNENLLLWLRQLYKNKDLIKSIKFLAVEIALFDLFHEKGMEAYNSVGIQEIIQETSDSQEGIWIVGLPKKYQAITHADVKLAFKWLLEVPVKQYTNEEFTNLVVDIENKKYVSADTCSTFAHLKNRYFFIAKKMPDFIENIIIHIKHNKEIFKKNKFSGSKIILALWIYKQISSKISSNKFDKQNFLYWLSLSFLQEAKWVICFMETDPCLDESERCKQAFKEFNKIYNP